MVDITKFNNIGLKFVVVDHFMDKRASPTPKLKKKRIDIWQHQIKDKLGHPGGIFYSINSFQSTKWLLAISYWYRWSFYYFQLGWNPAFEEPKLQSLHQTRRRYLKHSFTLWKSNLLFQIEFLQKILQEFFMNSACLKKNSNWILSTGFIFSGPEMQILCKSCKFSENSIVSTIDISPSQSATTILVLKTRVGLWPWKKIGHPAFWKNQGAKNQGHCYSKREEAAWSFLFFE